MGIKPLLRDGNIWLNYRNTPKSSILIGFSIIYKPSSYWGYPHLWKPLNITNVKYTKISIKMPSIGWLKFGPKIKVSRSVGSFVQSKRWLKSVPKDKPWKTAEKRELIWDPNFMDLAESESSTNPERGWFWDDSRYYLGWCGCEVVTIQPKGSKRIELRGKWNRTFSQNPRSFSSPWGVWTCPVPGWSLQQRLNFEGQPETTPCWDSGWSRHQRSHVEDSRVNSPCPSSDCICHQMSGFPGSCKSCLRNPTLRSGDQDNPWSLPMLLYMGYRWIQMILYEISKDISFQRGHPTLHAGPLLSP